MVDEIIMRGFWGPRPEAADELANRLAGFCRRLDLIFGSEGAWANAEKMPVRLADPSIARNFVQKHFDELSEGESPLGVIVVGKSTFPDGTTLSFNATAGGYSSLATLKNNVVIKYRPMGDRISLTAEIFDLLLESWAPDWGDLTSHTLWDSTRGHVHPKSRTPRAGYVTYLSSGRKRSLPAELAGSATDAVDGGVFIGHFASPVKTLTADEVAAVDNILRATDAFAPVPTDRSRY